MSSSQKLSVFPGTKLGSRSKLLTENNLTKLVYNLLDVDCYVALPINIDYQKILTIADIQTTLIDISDNIPDTLNFIMKGYQFAAPDIETFVSDLIGDNNSLKEDSGLKKIRAKIGIDYTDTFYTELAGESDFEAELSGTVADYFDDGGILKSKYISYDISDIKIIINDDIKNCTLDYNNALKVEDNTVPSGTDQIIITYYDYSCIINFDILSAINDNADSPQDPSFSDENVKEYVLDILYYQNVGQGRKYYLPISNLNKFRSTSITDIDGGLI